MKVMTTSLRGCAGFHVDTLDEDGADVCVGRSFGRGDKTGLLWARQGEMGLPLIAHLRFALRRRGSLSEQESSSVVVEMDNEEKLDEVETPAACLRSALTGAMRSAGNAIALGTSPFASFKRKTASSTAWPMSTNVATLPSNFAAFVARLVLAKRLASQRERLGSGKLGGFLFATESLDILV